MADPVQVDLDTLVFKSSEEHVKDLTGFFFKQLVS